MTKVSMQMDAALNQSIVGQHPGIMNQTRTISHVLHIFDYMIPFLIYGLCIVVLILAAMLEANPIIIGLSFAYYIFALWVSFPLSNTFHAIVSNPTLLAASTQYPTILWMIAEMPIILALFMGAYIVVIFLKFWQKRGVSYT